MLPDVWEFLRPRKTHLAIGFVLMAVNRIAGLVLPFSTKPLVDRVIIHHQAQLLIPIVSAVLGATAVEGATSFGLTQVLSKEAQRMIAELRVRIQSHVTHLPISYFDSNKTGTLVARIMSDVEGIHYLLGTGLVQFAGGCMGSCIALIILVKINLTMTVLALGILVLFALTLNRTFRIIRAQLYKRREINSELTGRLTESLSGARVVKGYHAEEREVSIFSHDIQRLLKNVLCTLNATSFMTFSSTLLFGFVSALIMYIGTRDILARQMTLGTFVTYTLFLGMLIGPIAQIVAVGTQLCEAMAGLERIKEVLAQRPEGSSPQRVHRLGPIRGDVEFNNVSFVYEIGKPVLHRINFHSPPGSITALVGSSGSGKSTIISLLCAFYMPNGGRILVDGIDIDTVVLDSYRTQLGIVLQEPFLFDGTVRENVGFSRPGATENEILTACRIARVDEFAEAFDDGYDTVIGERGIKVSGGQRQRISIARAILADPRILVLDEATSSLDSESEYQIQEGLTHLMRGRTTFVIAHRLSTIRKADQILVVEGGRIVEHGTHEMLLAHRGRYLDIYTQQHGVESNIFLVPYEAAHEAEIAARAEHVSGNTEPEGSGTPGFLRTRSE